MSDLLQQLNSEMSAVVETARRGLVQITNGKQRGVGAGTIWHADGLIITNAHVIRREPLEIILPDERKLPAKVLAHDSEIDLAALSVDAKDLPTVELGDSTDLQPGQLVLALGHPWGVAGAVCAGPVINVGAPPEIPRLTREFIQAALQLMLMETSSASTSTGPGKAL